MEAKQQGRGEGLTRRAVLALGLSSLAGCKLTLEQGLFGECREGTNLNALPIVQAAWKGLDPARVWDVHAHLFGNGRSGEGIWVASEFDHPFWPAARVRHAFYANA